MYVCMYVCAKNVKQVKESIGLLGAPALEHWKESCIQKEPKQLK